MPKSPWWSLAAVATLIGFVSDRSGYSITGDVESINLDIVLMLTPWGFIQNWLLTANHYLQPYYFEPSRRSDLFRDPILMALIMSLSLVAIASLYWIRAGGRRQ